MKTYSANPEDAMQDTLPAWVKIMRLLVFTLLFVMIIAMISIAYAALTLNLGENTDNLSRFFENVDIGAPIADRLNDDGSVVILHDRDGKRFLTEISPEGALIRETEIATAPLDE